jgi:FixJ family two-component response regulator
MSAVGVVAHNPQLMFSLGVAQSVFVVVSDQSIRRSLEAAISDSGWQVETFASAQEFLARPCFACPSCLILDVRLLGSNLLKCLADRAYVRVVLINGYVDAPMNVHATESHEPFESNRLLSAVRHAIDCSETAVRREQQIEALRARYESLTVRERQVMALVVEGLMNKQVGYELSLSEITVKAHRGKVMRKMKARSLADLVRMAPWLEVSDGQPATERLPASRFEVEKSSVAISIREVGVLGITMA